MANIIATPQQLSMLAQVMEAYCIAFSVDDPLKREELGGVLLELLQRGASTIDDLSAALDRRIGDGLLR